MSIHSTQSTQPLRKIAVRTGALVACALVLAACGSSKSSSADDSASKSPSAPPVTSASATAPPATDAAAGSAPNGTKLKTLLPTATHAPSGWKVDNSDAFDTGATVKSPGGALLPTDDCADALTNGGAQTLTSDYQAAYAVTGLTAPNDGSSNVVFNGYEPGDAVKQMTEVTTLVKRCASFSTKGSDGAKVKMTATLKSVAGLGDQALDVRVTPSGDYVGDDIVLVRSGDVVMGVDEDDSAGTMAPLVPVAEQLATTLPLKS